MTRISLGLCMGLLSPVKVSWAAGALAGVRGG